ncbi:MAG: hypothetical protein ACQEP1_06355 [Nanobdellota archaeon]
MKGYEKWVGLGQKLRQVSERDLGLEGKGLFRDYTEQAEKDFKDELIVDNNIEKLKSEGKTGLVRCNDYVNFGPWQEPADLVYMENGIIRFLQKSHGGTVAQSYTNRDNNIKVMEHYTTDKKDEPIVRRERRFYLEQDGLSFFSTQIGNDQLGVIVTPKNSREPDFSYTRMLPGPKEIFDIATEGRNLMSLMNNADGIYSHNGKESRAKFSQNTRLSLIYKKTQPQ